MRYLEHRDVQRRFFTAMQERFPVAAGKLTVPVAKRSFRVLSLP